MTSTLKKKAYLEKISRENPEYTEILELFLEIYGFLSGKEHETGISFTVRADRLKERVAAGFPLLTADDMTVDPARAASFMAGIVAILGAVGKNSDVPLAPFQDAVREGEVDLRPLFVATLGRDRRVIGESAARLGLPPALLEFIVETPLRTALERVATSLDPALVTGWQESSCPVCGSRPGMAELAGDEGQRLLSCSACSFTWPFTRLKCPYCGNEETDKLSYFQAGDGPVRVDICAACSRYIKTRDSRQGNADVPLEAEDLATIHLDLLAAREGYERGK